MITREALDKVRDLRKFYLYPHDWNQGIDENAGRRCGYEAGFDAAVSLLWPVIEAAYERDLDSSPELKQAIAQLKEKLK